MVNFEIDFNGIKFKNPILTASGTFGYGIEFKDFVNLNNLGGFIVKGTTRFPREGNPYPRMAETAMGMLNTVGLQNKGVEYFCSNIYPQLKDFDTHVIVNISGSTINDYVETAEIINELENIHAIELNISCPNVKDGGMAFGTSCESAGKVVKAVRKAYSKHLMVKLSPNVTDIAEIAKTVESQGADSISLVNTFLGMAIDIKTRKPKLSTITGGLSGPAIKPIALRMVWQVSKAVNIPVCGLGGIMNYEDVIEFLLAGASCVQIGTANFIYPDITEKIIHDLNVFCIQNKINNITELIGKMES